MLIPIDFQETFVKLERDTPDTKGGPAAVSDIKGWRPFCTDVPWSKGARIEAWMTIHDDFHSISLDIVADVCFKDLDTLTHSLSLSLWSGDFLKAHAWWTSESGVLDIVVMVGPTPKTVSTPGPRDISMISGYIGYLL